jgi:hypothetical protein
MLLNDVSYQLSGLFAIPLESDQILNINLSLWRNSNAMGIKLHLVTPGVNRCEIDSFMLKEFTKFQALLVGTPAVMTKKSCIN